MKLFLLACLLTLALAAPSERTKPILFSDDGYGTKNDQEHGAHKQQDNAVEIPKALCIEYGCFSPLSVVKGYLPVELKSGTTLDSTNYLKHDVEVTDRLPVNDQDPNEDSANSYTGSVIISPTTDSKSSIEEPSNESNSANGDSATYSQSKYGFSFGTAFNPGLGSSGSYGSSFPSSISSTASEQSAIVQPTANVKSSLGTPSISTNSAAGDSGTYSERKYGFSSGSALNSGLGSSTSNFGAPIPPSFSIEAPEQTAIEQPIANVKSFVLAPSSEANLAISSSATHSLNSGLGSTGGFRSTVNLFSFGVAPEQAAIVERIDNIKSSVGTPSSEVNSATNNSANYSQSEFGFSSDSTPTSNLGSPGDLVSPVPSYSLSAASENTSTSNDKSFVGTPTNEANLVTGNSATDSQSKYGFLFGSAPDSGLDSSGGFGFSAHLSSSGVAPVQAAISQPTADVKSSVETLSDQALFDGGNSATGSSATLAQSEYGFSSGSASTSGLVSPTSNFDPPPLPSLSIEPPEQTVIVEPTTDVETSSGEANSATGSSATSYQSEYGFSFGSAPNSDFGFSSNLGSLVHSSSFTIAPEQTAIIQPIADIKSSVITSSQPNPATISSAIRSETKYGSSSSLTSSAVGSLVDPHLSPFPLGPTSSYNSDFNTFDHIRYSPNSYSANGYTPGFGGYYENYEQYNNNDGRLGYDSADYPFFLGAYSTANQGLKTKTVVNPYVSVGSSRQYPIDYINKLSPYAYPESYQLRTGYPLPLPVAPFPSIQQTKGNNIGFESSGDQQQLLKNYQTPDSLVRPTAASYKERTAVSAFGAVGSTEPANRSNLPISQ